MSLYADDDLLPPDIHAGPSSPSSLTTTAPLDPLKALAHAVQLPAESQAQYDALQVAGTRFEEYPDKLPELCGSLLPMVVDGGESMLRTWGLDMVALAVGRSALTGEIKADVAQSSLDALNRLLHSNSAATIKAVIPIFSTIHPLLFRILATSRPPQAIYDAFNSSKRRILSFVLDPSIRPANKGIKAAAWKFAQKVLICGTRATSADPRLQRGGNTGGGGSDAHVGMIGSNSPLNSGELEEEAKMLQTQLVTQMFSSTDPSVLQPIFNIFPLLCKSRPHLASLLVPSMAAWTPAALEADGKAGMHIRSVEKTLRIVMAHLLKTSSLASFHAQLNEALQRQKSRMEAAFPAEQEQRRQRRQRKADIAQTAAGPTGLKHGLEAESSANGAKRARLEDGTKTRTSGQGEMDISGLVLDRIVEGVMGGLGAISMEDLIKRFENARQALVDDTPDAIPLLAQSLGVEKGKPKAEEGVLNPLEMDLDDDEDDLLLAEPLPEEIEDEAITVTEFHLPPPGPLDPSEKEELVTMALERICLTGDELAGLPDVDVKDGVKLAVQAKEAWMLVLVRLATRGQQEGKRKMISDYVAKDFTARSKLASVWLNEEWYSDLLNHTSNYPTHLSTILSAFLPTLTSDPKDKSLSTFLTSLPEITPQVIGQLISLCLEPDRGVTGFIALRELMESRPPTRAIGLTKLLELCTHPDRKIRYPAIKTVNRWVPDGKMAEAVVAYARGLLRRLGVNGTSDTKATVDGADGVETKADDDTDVDGDAKPSTNGESASTTLVTTSDASNTDATPVTTPYITSLIPDTVPQHVELAFALSRRRQDLLAEIFALYPRLSAPIAESIESLFVPLVQSLGPTNKLLEVIRNFPSGADKLALKVIGVLSSERGGAVVGEVVKGLLRSREDLDVGFVIPIIGELDKAEIEKQIPRIVSLLGTSESSRDLVRTAFAAALQKLTPADLLVSLHDEAESGRKATIEAIGICFSMTTVFRSDVLATSLSRITDLPTLPLVFLRTTIQAVSTYKSLIPFIANNILPKLVGKKVWETPPLWDGFTRLVKMIAPHSFGSVLQLPREEMRDLIKRQPGLRSALRGFLEGKGMGVADLEMLFSEA